MSRELERLNETNALIDRLRAAVLDMGEADVESVLLALTLTIAAVIRADWSGNRPGRDAAEMRVKEAISHFIHEGDLARPTH